jgi:hypothetical protein
MLSYGLISQLLTVTVVEFYYSGRKMIYGRINIQHKLYLTYKSKNIFLKVKQQFLISLIFLSSFIILILFLFILFLANK